MARGSELTSPGGWLERHTSQAPPALRDRVRVYAAAAAGDLPDALAVASRNALGHVLSHPGDRPVALDLLAADGLITLALLAQAESSPGRLRDFAASLLTAGVRGGD
ncbi:MAG: hypothetical protein ACM3OH_11920 [Bacillota bacterium]|jgi:hypothetical protein